MAQERRTAQRVSFSEDDGVICLLIKAEASGVTLLLPIMDISETGLKFLADTDDRHHFPVGDKLLLKQIIGTRHVKLPVPIGLAVRWHKADGERFFFGCEISFAAAESRKQFTQFVQSEIVFDQTGIQAQKRGQLRATDFQNDAIPMRFAEKVDSSSPSTDRVRRGAWILAALAAVSLISIGSILYTRHTQRTLTDRLAQLERGLGNGPELMRAIGQVKTDMASIEEEVSKLSESARKGQNTDMLLQDRVGDLERTLLQTEASGPSGVSLAKAEAAASRPPAETAAPQPSIEPDEPIPPTETAEPAPPDKPVPPQQAQGAYHTVQEGENLFRISVKYNVYLEKLAEINNMKVDDPIYAGQKIKLP